MKRIYYIRPRALHPQFFDLTGSRYSEHKDPGALLRMEKMLEKVMKRIRYIMIEDGEKRLWPHMGRPWKRLCKYEAHTSRTTEILAFLCVDLASSAYLCDYQHPCCEGGTKLRGGPPAEQRKSAGGLSAAPTAVPTGSATDPARAGPWDVR